MKEAFKLIKERLESEIESSDKYIREYDSSQVQIAWNKGMRKCLEIVSEVEAEYGSPSTNADRIRTMTDEELVKFLCEQGFCVDERCPRLWDETNCVECIAEWLKLEVK